MNFARLLGRQMKTICLCKFQFNLLGLKQNLETFLLVLCFVKCRFVFPCVVATVHSLCNCFSCVSLISSCLTSESESESDSDFVGFWVPPSPLNFRAVRLNANLFHTSIASHRRRAARPRISWILYAQRRIRPGTWLFQARAQRGTGH